MLARLIRHTNFKKFSVYALVAAGILFASCKENLAPPPPTTTATTWKITVDVTSGATAPTYSVEYSPSSGGCQYANSSANPTLLHVCTGDFLKWKAKSSAKKSEMVVFTSDGILANPGPASFPASDDNETSTGQVTSTADGPSTPPHEWYVAVYDKQADGKIHHGDPKIIVGR